MLDLDPSTLFGCVVGIVVVLAACVKVVVNRCVGKLCMQLSKEFNHAADEQRVPSWLV